MDNLMNTKNKSKSENEEFVLPKSLNVNLKKI